MRTSPAAPPGADAPFGIAAALRGSRGNPARRTGSPGSSNSGHGTPAHRPARGGPSGLAESRRYRRACCRRRRERPLDVAASFVIPARLTPRLRETAFGLAFPVAAGEPTRTLAGKLRVTGNALLLLLKFARFCVKLGPGRLVDTATFAY